jgi:hypothetical protein
MAAMAAKRIKHIKPPNWPPPNQTYMQQIAKLSKVAPCICRKEDKEE